MTAASVGFQCPECIKDGRKSVRQARTIAGARVTADSPVTRVLLGINVGIFLLVYVGGARAIRNIVDPYIMDPIAIARHGEYYRLLTSTFLHAEMLHIAFNMYALLVLGDQVERILGRWRYLALYFASGLGGGAASYYFSPARGASLGASGAIFGLFGAIFVIQRRLRGDMSGILITLVLNLVIAVAIPRIDWRAHLGGLAVGAAITAGYVYLGRGNKRAVVHAGVVVAVVALTIASVLIRTQQIRHGLRY